jgi:thiol-disulfide isomerase/thioredoxin
VNKVSYSKALLSGLVATTLVAVLFYAGFSYWRTETVPPAISQIDLIQRMETEGVPNFSGKTLNGSQLQVADFKGKVVIINFWASWCAPCMEEFPSLVKLLQTFGSDLVLLAVSQDSEESDIVSFLKSFPDLQGKPNIFIVTDYDNKIAAQFKTDRLPESYIVGKDGMLKKKIIGTIDWATEDAEKYLRALL